jgi:hypothetical protein
MKPATFFLGRVGRTIGQSFWLEAGKGFCVALTVCAAATCALGGDASKERVRAHKKWNGVQLNGSVYHVRTRNFEKPWPFGQALGPGDDSD